MSKKAIIIGSGFGGLSLGIRLQAMGFETTILEKLDKAGGRGYQKVVNVDGIEGEFKFDMGPTVLTVPHFYEEIFSIQKGDKFAPNHTPEALDRWEEIRNSKHENHKTGGASPTYSKTNNTQKYVNLVPVFPFYRIYFSDGTFFDYDGDYQHTIEQIEALSGPEDVQGFINFSKEASKVFQRGFLELGYNYFGDPMSMIKLIPEFLQMDIIRSLFSYTTKFFKSDKIRKLFSFETLLLGGNSFSVPAIYVLVHFVEKSWGVHYAMGGTGNLVKGLVRKYEELGGSIKYNSEVETIITEGKTATGVKLKNGEIMTADLITSNADYANTYLKLLDKAPKLINSDFKVKTLTNYSMSLVVVYFAFKKDPANDLGKDLRHHNIILGPDFRKELSNIFVKHELTEEYSQYLHVPTVTDPSLAPEGYHTAYTLICVPNLEKEKQDWSKIEEAFVENIMKVLDEKGFIPNLRERLVHKSFITPNYFKNNLNSYIGNAFGVTPLFRQSAFFRPHNRSEDIKGLYIVGASTMPGAGTPSVMMSAKITAREIAKDFGIEV
jgi:phytoene desaturase